MLSLFMSPFYILGNIYILYRILRWLQSCHRVFDRRMLKISLAVLYSLIALAIGIAFFLPSGSGLRRVLQLISNYWMGILLYTLQIIGLGQGASLLLRHVLHVLPVDFFHTRRNHILSGLLALTLIASVSVYGVYHARDVKLNEYELHIDKPVQGENRLKILLIADLHLGYNAGLTQVEKAVSLINKQSPDLVCLAGDIFDNNYDAIREPDAIADALAGIESTYGVYACWGNHDVDERMLAGFPISWGEEAHHHPGMYDFLERAGVKLLEDEAELVDGRFYVAGRLDESKPATPDGTRKTAAALLDGLDKSKPVIVLYHEPDELQELAGAGCDLLLSGHTHNGQLFPATLLIKLLWENAEGYLKKDNLHSVVTSGLGAWGPFMRVGSDAEVVSIDVSFNSK